MRQTISGLGDSRSRTGCMEHHGLRHMPTGFFSGSPIVYPPLGAVGRQHRRSRRSENTFARLHARNDSSAIPYGVAAYRAQGRRYLCALWALSEPAIRLAFATFDPLSVFLTALSVWLIVQAGYRRHAPWWLAQRSPLQPSQRDSLLGDHYRPCGCRIRILGLAPYACAAGGCSGLSGSQQAGARLWSADDCSQFLVRVAVHCYRPHYCRPPKYPARTQ